MRVLTCRLVFVNLFKIVNIRHCFQSEIKTFSEFFLIKTANQISGNLTGNENASNDDRVKQPMKSHVLFGGKYGYIFKLVKMEEDLFFRVFGFKAKIKESNTQNQDQEKENEGMLSILF